MSQTKPQRVIAYVDGFNLYYGLHDSRLRRFYWLNIKALAENLLRPGQQLVATKYFTARISGALRNDPPAKARKFEAKRKRQSDFLEALGTLNNFEIYEGHFLGKAVRCHQCGSSWRTHEEKMTDVQIATQMLTDAFQNRYDTALVISADSDLVPPSEAIHQFFPDKRIVVAFPPGRSSAELLRTANAAFVIGRGKLKKSQFPDKVKKPDGYVLRRPKRWQ